jgi:hypothetical protein
MNKVYLVKIDFCSEELKLNRVGMTLTAAPASNVLTLASTKIKAFDFASGEIIPGAYLSHTSKVSPSYKPGTSVLRPGRDVYSFLSFAVIVERYFSLTAERALMMLCPKISKIRAAASGFPGRLRT